MEAAVEKRWSVTVLDLQAWTCIIYTGLPAERYARETLLFLLLSHTTVFLVGLHAVCLFGMADGLN